MKKYLATLVLLAALIQSYPVQSSEEATAICPQLTPDDNMLSMIKQRLIQTRSLTEENRPEIQSGRLVIRHNEKVWFISLTQAFELFGEGGKGSRRITSIEFSNYEKLPNDNKLRCHYQATTEPMMLEYLGVKTTQFWITTKLN